MKKTLIATTTLGAALLLTACGTVQVPGMGAVTIPEVDPRGVLKDGDSHELKMFKAKAQAAKDLAPPPILEITAHPGQTIEFKGIQSLKVHAPGSNQVVATIFKKDPTLLDKALDFTLRAGEILVNPLVSLKLGKENAITQREQINANVQTHAITLGTIKDVADAGINKQVFALPLPAPHTVPPQEPAVDPVTGQ